MITAMILVAGMGVALVLVSYLVEARRPEPVPPGALSWAPNTPVRYLAADGVRLRYITLGSGRPLVLLHTLRTQLDMFQKLIPLLSSRFQVYALDYPGHGFSDIPSVEYSAEFFIGAAVRFLELLDIKDAAVAGESIGGTIALTLAARRNPRVRWVVAVNPYDYDAGRGLRRSSALANLLFGLNNVPILGATVMRLRNFEVVRRIFEGGVYRRESLPPDLAREMYQVGNRRGHYRALMSLVRYWPDWEALRAEYPAVQVPVLLLYGDHDWSRPAERDATMRAIPGARLKMMKDTGHFASLDSPEEIIQALEFLAAAGQPPATSG